MKKLFKLCLLSLCLLPALCRGQIITTIAGNGVSGSSGDGGAATSARLGTVHYGVFDRFGNYYFSEILECKVRKISPTGIITTIAGTGVVGFGGDGGPATLAKLKFPEGVACDSLGNIYVADQQNYRIRKVDATTGIISTVAGTGVTGDLGDGGPATAASLFPQDIQFDKQGNLYISSSNFNKIRKINPVGTISTIAGNGTAGFTGDGGMATSASMSFPVSLAIDDTGNVYFVDDMNRRVRKVDTLGYISTIAGNGIGLYNADGIPATTAQLSAIGICFHNSTLYITDSNQRIRTVGPSGIIHTIAGIGIAGYNGDGIAATAAKIYNAGGITNDSCGNIYFDDVINYRIRKIIYDSACGGTYEDLNTKATSRLQAISIYPNPTTNLLNIDGEELTAYTMHSIVGTQVQQGALHSDHNSINTGRLPAGIYLLELTNQHGQRTITRVVKQ